MNRNALLPAGKAGACKARPASGKTSQQSRLLRLPAQPVAGGDASEGAPAWEETWILCPAALRHAMRAWWSPFVFLDCYFSFVKSAVWANWSLRSLPATILDNIKLLKKHKR